jgi:hypothetical protein
MTQKHMTARSLIRIVAAFAFCLASIHTPASPAAPFAPTTNRSTATTKPWVEDFPAFVNATGGKRWIVGRSTAVCLNEREASEAATRDAGKQLYAHLRPRLSPSLGSESDAWLKRRLADELALGGAVNDRWVSRVRKPYGEIWAEAVLVDASTPRFATLVREHERWVRGKQASTRSTAGSVLGLSAAILLIYVVLNVLTKGYFRGRLRGAAAVAFGLALFLINWWPTAGG